MPRAGELAGQNLHDFQRCEDSGSDMEVFAATMEAGSLCPAPPVAIYIVSNLATMVLISSNMISAG
jgi:hypothetical protein